MTRQGQRSACSRQIAQGDHLVLTYSINLSSFVGTPAAAGLPPPKQQNSVDSVATIPDGYAVVVGGLSWRAKAPARARFLCWATFRAWVNSSRAGPSVEPRNRFFVFIRWCSQWLVRGSQVHLCEGRDGVGNAGGLAETGAAGHPLGRIKLMCTDLRDHTEADRPTASDVAVALRSSWSPPSDEFLAKISHEFARRHLVISEGHRNGVELLVGAETIGPSVVFNIGVRLGRRIELRYADPAEIASALDRGVRGAQARHARASQSNHRSWSRALRALTRISMPRSATPNATFSKPTVRPAPFGLST